VAPAAAAVIALIPIVVAVLLSSGSSSAGSTSPARASSPYKPFAPQAKRSAQPKPSTRANPPVPAGKGALVAVVHHSTRMRSSPGGHAYVKVPTHTEFGSPQAMWVVRTSGPWLGVISPLAGNGKVGWIPARAASLSRVSWQLKVTLAERRLTVLDKGHVRARFTIAVGAPDAPTPTGRFAVTDRLTTGDNAGPYGCCILALSAKAPHAISDWDGGNRIAIHSTPETSSIGKPVSHGCMRLTLAEGRWLLNHIPLGTPTVVQA
jgi:lipoprotein-anchoring transpeptidase ErfK/SrfK